MRNLKRVLSLALALVMVLGMMVITTSAADFTDADEITYTEAVDVISAIGVITGDNGNFYPTRALTREEGAAFICYMLMGKDAADKLVGSGNFSDVAANRWSAGEIDYCANLGIVKGVGDGKFNPKGELTAVQFGGMLLGALGYDGSVEGYTGANWASAIAADMIDAGLDVRGVSMDATLTREQAAQMALQALKADMVKYTTKGTQVSINGVDIVTGASEATIVTNANLASKNNISAVVADGVQFAEKYFPTLKYVTTGDKGYDGMHRPSHTWEIGLDAIGEYSHTPSYTFVINNSANPMGTPNTAKLIEKKLGKDVAIDANCSYVNGELNTDLNVGDIAEVYVDLDGVYCIATTRYDVDVVTGAVAVKGKGAQEQVRVPGVLSYTSTKKVVGYEDLKPFDIVYKYTDIDGVTYLAAAESFDGTLTQVNNVTPKTYVVGGETYTANESIPVDAMNLTDPVFNTEYRFYTDNNGYVIFGEQIEETLSDYVVIDEIKFVEGDGSLTSKDRVEARIVKMDGTTEIVNIASITGMTGGGMRIWTGTTTSDSYDNNAADSTTGADDGRYLVYKSDPVLNGDVNEVVNKQFFTYTVNFKGEYSLTYVDAINVDQTPDTSITLEAGKVSKGGSTIPVTDETIFIVENKAGPNWNHTYTVYTGKYEVPNMTGANVAYVVKNGVVTHMFIDSYTTATITGNTVFFLDATPKAYYEVKTAAGSYGYHTYDAIVNGEYAEVKVAANAPSGGSFGANALSSGTVAVDLFVPTYNTNGVITALSTSGLTDEAVAYGYKLTGTTLVTGKTGINSYANHYVCGNDTVAYFVDVDGNMDTLYVADLAADANDNIYVVKGQNNSVAYVVVFEKDADESGLEIKVGTTTNKNFTKMTNGTMGGQTGVTYYKHTGAAGEDITITAEAGVVVQYTKNVVSWYNADGIWAGATTEYISDATTLTLSDAGTYRLAVTAEDGSIENFMLIISD